MLGCMDTRLIGKNSGLEYSVNSTNALFYDYSICNLLNHLVGYYKALSSHKGK